ncbi:MAG: peptide chain release factor N(5)-glutamine methyltransferase [Elusimicrobiota bacterium]|jgi:release factor glutamine methyltransferase|nr:peptide chain release factor N(5)-glutamine methyltransferase [Elusimicrobiota bacterium]
MITIGQLVNNGIKKLEEAGIDEPAANGELIAAFVLNKSRTYIRAFGQNIIHEKEEALFNKILGEKLRGRPLAHIIGEAEFLGRLFSISPTVLIPRPETEELIEQSLKHLSISQPQNILDLCTGSGCIAISLAFLFKTAKITSADISAEALKVALKNAQNLNVEQRINFVKTDLFEQIEGKFDFIISNPPYIPTDIIATLSPEVKCEPNLALDGGADGLRIIEKIVKEAPKYLSKNGLLALEIGHGQAQKVVEFFKSKEWLAPKTGKDIAGIERFIFAQKK